MPISRSKCSPARTSSTPARTSLVYQLVRIGARTPTVPERPDASREAFGLAT
ncbi:MAG: hypothetical protein V9E89_00635 [Ilumatobacteraceae bacterium]